MDHVPNVSWGLRKVLDSKKKQTDSDRGMSPKLRGIFREKTMVFVAEYWGAYLLGKTPSITLTPNVLRVERFCSAWEQEAITGDGHWTVIEAFNVWEIGRTMTVAPAVLGNSDLDPYPIRELIRNSRINS